MIDFTPAKSGIKFKPLSLDNLKAKPNPTNDDLARLYEAEQGQSIGQKVASGAEGFGRAVAHTAALPVTAVKEIAADPSLSRAAATVPETAAQIGRGYLDLLAKPVLRKISDYKLNPVRATLADIPLAGQIADKTGLLEKALPKSAQEKSEEFNVWKLNYLAKLAAADMPASPDALRFGVKPYQATAEGASIVFDPANYASLGTTAAGKQFLKTMQRGGTQTLVDRALRVAEKPGVNLAAKAGQAVESAGAGLRYVGELPERLVGKATEAAFGPETAEQVNRATKLTAITGAPLGAAAAVVGAPVAGAAIAAPKTLQAVGVATEKAGQFATRLAQADKNSPLGRLWEVAHATDAPEWMRRLAGSKAAAGAAGAAKLGSETVKGAASGAAVGATLGAATADNAEEFGQAIGTGATIGAGVRLLAQPAIRRAKIVEQNLAGAEDFIRRHAESGVSPETLKKVSDSAYVFANVVEKIFGKVDLNQKTGVQVKFVDGETYKELTGQRSAGHWNETDRTIYINADNPGRSADVTILHEVAHPLFESALTNQPELRSVIDAQLKAKGLNLEAAKQNYAEALVRPQFEGQPIEERMAAAAQWVQQMDAQDPSGNWIYSELLAESALRNLFGKEVVADVLSPAALQPVTDVLKKFLGNLGVRVREPKPDTIIAGFDGVLDTPAMREQVTKLLRKQKDFLPGLEEAPEASLKVSDDMHGKHPAAPVQDLGNGTKGNDFSVVKPDGKIEIRKPFQVKRIIKSRRAEVNAAYPVDRPPLPVNDASPQVRQRHTTGGKTERSGTVLGPEFDALKSFGAGTKAMAHDLEAAIAGGEARAGWYQQIGEGADWKASVAKDTGALSAQFKEFIPFGFFVDKQGNVLVRNYSLTALDRKAAKWAARNGDLSLDLWGSDIAKFRDDVRLYLDNHKTGQAGETGLGVEKKNVINAFLVGGNRMFEAKNPLRTKAIGEDRQGIVRSYRLDRLETIEPHEAGLAKPDYQRQVQNFSPEGERVLEAAIKLADGKLFRGPYHGAAYADAEAAGINDFQGAADGWVTTAGRFISPEEAYALALSAKQIDRAGYRQAQRDTGLFHEAALPRELEASSFDLLKVRRGNKTPEAEANQIVEDAITERAFSPAGNKFVDINAKDDVKSAAMKHSLGKKKVKLVHLSSNGGLKVVDPEFFGKGKATHQDRSGTRKSFFFVEGSPLQADAYQFGQGGMKAYTAEISGEKLYNLSVNKADVLGYFDEINRAKADDKVKAAGYDGIYIETGDGRKVVLLFKKLPVTLAGNFKGKKAVLSKVRHSAEGTRFQEDTSKTGLAFKDFFSRVTKGEFGKSDKPFEPVIDLEDSVPFLNELANHSGNFDDHIAKSIPTYKETQVKKGQAIVKTFGEGARMLDIAASEGSLGKTITALSGGKIVTVSLDPNPDMAGFFRTKSTVPGAEYVEEAFLDGFQDGDKVVPAYNPDAAFDVIHEAMGFQFISGERAKQIAEARRLLAPDGVLLVEEKVRNDNWKANETKKDTDWKAKYFSTTELAAKDKVVGYQQSKQEAKAVGMIDNMVKDTQLEGILSEQFGHVVQYWDSGNFKGYAASDSPDKLQALVANMGDLNSEFSTVQTPRAITSKTAERAAYESLVEQFKAATGADKFRLWSELENLKNSTAKKGFKPASPEGFELTRPGQQLIELTGPDGKKYPARFEGWQDARIVGKGWQPMITVKMPGFASGTTGLGPTFERAGYTLPELTKPADLHSPEGNKYELWSWEVLGDKVVGKSRVAPASQGKPPKISLEQLAADGFKTVDYLGNGSHHDYETRPVFYKDNTGRYPATAEGIKQALQAATESEVEVWEAAYGEQPAKVQASPEGIKPPSEATAPRFGKAWLSPDGKFHALDGLIHEQWAAQALGLPLEALEAREGSPASRALFKRGWLRVTPFGSDTIMTNTESGLPPTAKQKATMTNLAKTAGVSGYYHDNGSSPRVIWSESDAIAASPEGFVSQLEKTVEEKFTGKAMPAAQLAAVLRNPQNSIKVEELKWSGIEEFLKGKSKVTREEVQEFLKANRVELTEVVKGEAQVGKSINHASPFALPEVVRVAERHQGAANDALLLALENDGDAYRALSAKFPTFMEADNWAESVADEVFGSKQNVSGAPKFANYQLPGGKNYREILFRLPAKEAALPKGWRVVENDNDSRFPVFYEVLDENNARIAHAETEQIALMRAFRKLSQPLTELPEGYELIRDHNGPDGKEWGIIPPGQNHARPFEGLHETQSLAKASALERLNRERADAASFEAMQARKDTQFKGTHWDEGNVVAHTRVNDRVDTQGRPGLFAEELQSDWHQTGRKEGYRTAAPALTPKEQPDRSWAIVNSADAVVMAGFSHREAAQRYISESLTGLGESTSAVPDAPFKDTWHELVFRRLLQKAVAEGKEWLGWTTGEQQATRYDLSKHAEAVWVRQGKTEGTFNIDYQPKGEYSFSSLAKDVPREQVPQYIGKELTAKLQPDGKGLFKGVDLKVGGKGMKGFYDKILVDYANKFAKKFGGRVTEIELPSQLEGSKNFSTFERQHLRGYPSATPEEVQSAFAKFQAAHTVKVHAVEITPAMREALPKGVVLFSPEGKPLDPKVVARVASRIASATESSGGATFNVAGNKLWRFGKDPVYLISPFPERSLVVQKSELTPAVIAEFINKNTDLLGDERHNVGTWVDGDKVWIDVSWSTKDRGLAEYGGRKFNQKAIFDLKAGSEIATGGTGEAPEHLTPAPQRVAALEEEYNLQHPKAGQTEMLGRVVFDPKGKEMQNVRELQAVRPDRNLTPTEQAASDLARRNLRERVQLVESVDEKVKIRRAIQMGVPEVVEFLKRQSANKAFDSGKEWYRKDIAKMEETTRQLFPETNEPQKMTVFKVLLAAFSGGEKPKGNYQLAAEAFAVYLKTGEVPMSTPFRVSETGKEKILGRTAEMTAEKLSKMFAALGGEKAFADYVTTKHAETIMGHKDAYGALDLGPKFGRFFLNLTGHADEVTVDLWATRTWHRWMSTPFHKIVKDGETKYQMPDVPTDAMRDSAITAFRSIAEEVSSKIGEQIDAMDVQAVLWFYEKDLYIARGVRVDRGSFSEGAASYAADPLHKGVRVTGVKPVPKSQRVDPNQVNLF